MLKLLTIAALGCVGLKEASNPGSRPSTGLTHVVSCCTNAAMSPCSTTSSLSNIVEHAFAHQLPCAVLQPCCLGPFQEIPPSCSSPLLCQLQARTLALQCLLLLLAPSSSTKSTRPCMAPSPSNNLPITKPTLACTPTSTPNSHNQA